MRANSKDRLILAAIVAFGLLIAGIGLKSQGAF